MKLHQLRSAAAVVETDLNLTRAAVKLNATQPGVSAHIRALEDEIGAQLFVRDRKRFSGMTPIGKELLPGIMDIVARADELSSRAKELTSPRERPIVIASGPTPALILPQTLSKFFARYPHVKVKVRSGCHKAIVGDLTESRADICLLSNVEGSPSSIAFQYCYALGWILLASERCELIKAPELTLQAINQYPIITYDDDYASSRAIARAFEAANLDSNISIRASEIEAMKRSVRAGLGVAILRAGTFEPDQDHGMAARSLDHLLPPSEIYAGVRRNAELSAPLRHMLSLLRSASTPGAGEMHAAS